MARKKTDKNQDEKEKVISELQGRLKALEKELEASRARNGQQADKIERLACMVIELEGKVSGWQVEHSFIQRIDLAPTIEEAGQLLNIFAGQEGFCGGRLLTKYKPVKVQTFWQDDDPPSSWYSAVARSEQLPDELRYVHIPPSLQKSLFLLVSKVNDQEIP